MKIVLLYLRILKKSDPGYVEPKSYEESTKRFLSTYRQFKPNIEHELVVVNCGSEAHDGLFDNVVSRYETDMGGGFDCGSFKHIGGRQSCDLVVGLNTHTYFWRDGWLEPFAQCAQQFGKGVYGASASYDCHPHLRTPCIAFSPQVARQYPYPVVTRLDAGSFEGGPNNFSLWARNNNYASRLVTATSSYGLNAWRSTKNGFRQGNQTDCLVFDRHTDLYAKADKATKLKLQRDADNHSL